MMRAAAIDQPGGPEKLYVGEAPIPALRQREVLIRVITTAINRADTLQVSASSNTTGGRSRLSARPLYDNTRELGVEGTTYSSGASCQVHIVSDFFLLHWI